MTKIVSLWHLEFLQKTDNVSKDVHDITEIGYLKKRRAKKAIRRLLSIAPHSVDEIADHFEISAELVKGLLMELTRANLVTSVPGYSSKYCLKVKLQ